MNKRNIDMCHGPILKNILLFALPLMASNVLQILFNSADTMIVGKFVGEHALAAVGSSGPVVNIIIKLFLGLSVGVNVVVAQFLGAKKEKDVKESVHTAVTLSVLCGVFLTIVGMIFSPELLRLMKSPEEVIPLATVYLRVYFLGIPFSMLYNFAAAILRAAGDTKRPMWYLAIAGVLNVLLNIAFVMLFQWGVFGVALATVISQGVSALCVVMCLVRDDAMLRLEWKKLRIYGKKCKEIIRIGIPSGLQSTLFSFSDVMMQTSTNSLGVVVLAGNAAASNIIRLIYVAMNAFYQATISFTSQNMGAKKYKRINEVFYTALLCTLCSGIVLGVGSYLAGPWLLKLFASSKEVIEIGMIQLAIVGTTYVIGGVMDVIVGSLRGMGCVMVPTIVSIFGVVGTCAIWTLVLFPMERFHSIEFLNFYYPVSWVLTGIVHFITFTVVRKKIKDNRNCI